MTAGGRERRASARARACTSEPRRRDVAIATRPPTTTTAAAARACGREARGMRTTRVVRGRDGGVPHPIRSDRSDPIRSSDRIDRMDRRTDGRGRMTERDSRACARQLVTVDAPRRVAPPLSLAPISPHVSRSTPALFDIHTPREQPCSTQLGCTRRQARARLRSAWGSSGTARRPLSSIIIIQRQWDEQRGACR